MMDMTQIEESTLLSLLQAGNRDAFSEVYRRYWKKLFTVASHKLQDLAEAEEQVQDIFLEIWNRRESLSIQTTLSAYLAAAVKYKVINVLAKRHQQWKYASYAQAHQTEADHSTEQWLDFAALQQRLEELVAALPEKCQLVFRLSREKGMSQKEIASTLHISEKTVEAHLGKATKLLRLNLGAVAAIALLGS